jgi:hypothetical protein
MLPLIAAACKVEPTPRSFYNHRNPAVVEMDESSGEIRARVIRFVTALNRGDSIEAMEAMNPSEVVQVLGPSDADSMAGVGRAALMSAMSRIRRPSGGIARAPDLRVGAGQAMGWFSTNVVLLPVTGSGDAERLRLSGVFTRDRGDWRLVEAHLSQPGITPPADSAVSSPDSAEAQEEGG